jgi:FixJ family two-component response regulator
MIVPVMTQVASTVRFHVVEDHADACAAIAGVLRARGFQVLCHASAESFLDAYDPTRVEALMLDLTLPGLNGFEQLATLRQRCEGLPVLAMSGDAAVERVVRAMQNGVVGFLGKPPRPDALLEHAALMVGQAVACAANRAELRRLQDLRKTLTGREAEVLGFVARGMTAKQIAHELDLSLRTAHIHRTNVLRKFGVESAVELARRAAILDQADQAAAGAVGPRHKATPCG